LNQRSIAMNRSSAVWVAWAGWLLAALYYFYQYALRSAPAVMIPQLSEAFGISAAGVASLVGVFYYGYGPFSLVAGAAIDRVGARLVMAIGITMVATGAFLFGSSNAALANFGRLIQGVGGTASMVGAVYIASRNFPASQAATLIGATQMFGMAGGSAGTLLVGPAIAGGLPWDRFWSLSAVAGLLLAAAVFVVLPKQKVENQESNWIGGAVAALVKIFKNRQSILCGLIAGLLFAPTNIFGMIWGVRFLQEAHEFSYGEAVLRSSTLSLGWIIGCPLIGLLSDRLGRRKPVIIGGACVLAACLAWILYGPADVFPSYVLGTVAGVASGAAMLPYSVIKESNPPHLSGTATGVMNLLTFTMSALLGPVFGWIMQSVTAGHSTDLEKYQMTFQPLLYGVALAALLTLLLIETGGAARISEKVAATA
jgi:MFS family permease